MLTYWDKDSKRLWSTQLIDIGFKPMSFAADVPGRKTKRKDSLGIKQQVEMLPVI